MIIDRSNLRDMAQCSPDMGSDYPASPTMDNMKRRDSPNGHISGSPSNKRLIGRAKRQLSLTLDVISERSSSNVKNARLSDSALFSLSNASTRESQDNSGGFLNFQASHPNLCESKSTSSASSGNYKCAPLTSMSQPCLSTINVGPTRILPFLFLGSQQDALSQETAKQHGINYVLNVSTTCPKPGHITDNHFHRIPVNDNYSDKLLPHFDEAFQFINKVREANGCVLVHCLAGISRSPTLAIAYVMKYLNTGSEEAYRYVKDKRPTISPNFNFLGQLSEYEEHIRKQGHSLEGRVEPELNTTSSLGGAIKRESSPSFCHNFNYGMRKSYSLQFHPQRETPLMVQSPTTALARLNFNSPSPIDEGSGTLLTAQSHLNFPQFPTTSLDKLSFTPCFAKDDLPLVHYPSGINNNNKTSGGTKRPLSTSNHDNTRTDCMPCSEAQSTGNADSNSSSIRVTCRSPESRAKRPLVRPNSIAFSTYPKFDFNLEQPSLVKSPGWDKSPAQTPGNSYGEHCHEIKNHSTNLLREKESGSNSTRQNLARKSQSLEDIMNSQMEEESSDWLRGSEHGLRSRQQSHVMVHAADVFSQPVALDHTKNWCCVSTDPHQSSSSISSSGSHNSLQGSLEMIPVS